MTHLRSGWEPRIGNGLPLGTQDPPQGKKTLTVVAFFWPAQLTPLLRKQTLMSQYAIHEHPAGLDKANYVVNVDLARWNMQGRKEQLWTRQIDGAYFELCCIPFFTYGFALGDLLEQRPDGNILVARHMGHQVLRAAAADISRQGDLHAQLHEWAEGTGFLYEWYSPGYLALDLPPGCAGALDLTAIEKLESSGHISYEIDECL